MEYGGAVSRCQMSLDTARFPSDRSRQSAPFIYKLFNHWSHPAATKWQKCHGVEREMMHAGTRVLTEDRRKTPRFPIAIRASVNWEGKPFSVIIANISDHGLLLSEASFDPPVGSLVTIRCAGMVRQARIIWIKANKMGVRLGEPIHALGVVRQCMRCKSIKIPAEARPQEPMKPAKSLQAQASD